ncbi:hypothetical protein [Chlamydiifrater phoenicopteri]|uniref:hypothetical protein n=1 Tax=Chlamydiifrater phoenicopteri TaxID=2681469 RepID=UPI001BCFAFFE|nr:hypothetical protein [Chlamydiifrater phoenicopteri]
MSEKSLVTISAKIKFLTLLFTCFLSFPVSAEFSRQVLKEQLLTGSSGDYIVLAKGRSFSFLSLQKTLSKKIFIEEVFFPHLPQGSQQELFNLSSKDALLQKYPGTKTHLTLSEENLFSLEDPKADINMLCFLNTLLHLPFSPSPSSSKKTQETSFLPLTIDGERSPKVPVRVFESFWPEDHSPLSGRKILIYLTDPTISPFPARVVIESPRGRITIRSINLGKSKS